MTQALLKDSVLQLSGVLDFRSANRVLEDARQQLSGYAGAQLTIDCSGVEKSSSVGIALLLALLADLQGMQVQASLTALPEDMCQIAQVCDLESVLSVQT